MNPVRVFALAQGAVDHLPESAGRAVFDVVGTFAGLLPIGGTKQLRKNQARLRPGMKRREALALSAKAMRSYMRYYYESFRLSRWDEESILARVSGCTTEHVREELQSGSVTGALMHAGNWDLAGAWANIDLATVHTIAEKLEPPELFQGFLSFRESLGMTIYPLVKGGGALRSLEADMRENHIFTPMLADRDLSASGIEVTLAGIPMLVAPGPALLAQRTGCGLYPVYISYEKLTGSRRAAAGTKWGTRIDILPAVRATTTPHSAPAEREVDIARMCQEWVDTITPYLLDHLEDWHMLQKVFVEDLDPARLAKSRAKAAAAARGEDVNSADSQERQANLSSGCAQSGDAQPTGTRREHSLPDNRVDEA
ncbi:phosphatidylinositol mannoside acyltransferase [Changpingibacter yushuensis]|uniref:phosphatidylinositol mannoside acyltransferase n=1 Tax=Changpingibacter yushuensis TaxID=2758440 RepID=UPI00165E8172|nr:phosphatidylinositol mannoside acyltransferase [Changpingibacter yushuensis]